MQSFIYRNATQVHFGPGVLAAIGPRIAAESIASVLVVTGGSAAQRCGALPQVEASLAGAGIAVTHFAGVTPNPSLEVVLRCRDLLAQVQGVVAVGGGSVMDAAKAAAALYHVQGDPWQAFAERRNLDKAVPVFTVPTLSGTGSELNGTAVITNEATQQKWGMRGAFPVAAFMDPTLQAGLPWALTMTGAIDAMTHVLEFSVAGQPLAEGTDVPVSGGPYFAEEAVLAQNEALLRTLVRSATLLRQQADHYEARASLAWAAGLALGGITGVGLGAGSWDAHSLEHAVSGMRPEVPHGLGLAVLFPCWMEVTLAARDPMFARLARNVWGVQGAQAGIDAMRACFRNWGAPANLQAWGFTAEDVEPLVELAMQYPRPLLISREQVAEVFRRAMG